MIEVLQFIFSSFWVWAGSVFLLNALFGNLFWLVKEIIKARVAGKVKV